MALGTFLGCVLLLEANMFSLSLVIENYMSTTLRFFLSFGIPCELSHASDDGKKSNFQVSSSLNFLFSWEFKSTLPSKSRTKKSFPRKVVKQNSENYHDTMKFLAEVSLNVLMTECLFLTKVLRSKS